jgi:histone H2A
MPKKEVHEKFNFFTHISKVLKQVHPELGITTEALNEVNLLCHIFAERIVNEATDLSKMNSKKTIGAREIQTAVRTCLPGELTKHAVSEGTKAHTRYSMMNNEHGSRSKKASLVFPVGRIETLIRHHSGVERVSGTAAVYLAAVLEYLAAEILELSGNAARDNKKKRVTTRHLLLAIRYDEDLNILTHTITLSGGVPPNIYAALLPRKSTARASKSNTA